MGLLKRSPDTLGREPPTFPHAQQWRGSRRHRQHDVFGRQTGRDVTVDLLQRGRPSVHPRQLGDGVGAKGDWHALPVRTLQTVDPLRVFLTRLILRSKLLKRRQRERGEHGNNPVLFGEIEILVADAVQVLERRRGCRPRNTWTARYESGSRSVVR
jgi:hypothetical protein